jgi:hypothetical protein
VGETPPALSSAHNTTTHAPLPIPHPNPDPDPNPNLDPNPDPNPNPDSNTTTDHRVFTVYQPRITFTSDSGATDILVTQHDSTILTNYTPYTHNSNRPGFSIANLSKIYPIATDQLCIPHTSVSLTAYVFSNTDLSDNLFGLAPDQPWVYRHLLTHWHFHPHHTVIYGTKHPLDNIWKFSPPKPDSHAARIVVRHEQDAKLVMYASASFGSPAYQTFYNAVHMGWLTNYPDLTPQAVRRNKPHSPATALGHITASRFNVRSSRLTFDDSPKLALSAQPSAFVEALNHYSENELPDIVLRCTVQHYSAFRHDAIYSDLPGRFPVRAKDGSEYLLLSVYKNYIHVETLPSSPHLCAAYSATHTFFRKLGHQLKVQILDNETSESLFTYFDTEHIAYQPVPTTRNALTLRSGLFKPFAGTFSVAWQQLTPHFPSTTGRHSYPKLS